MVFDFIFYCVTVKTLYYPTYTKLEIILFSFHCRVIRQQEQFASRIFCQGTTRQIKCVKTSAAHSEMIPGNI